MPNSHDFVVYVLKKSKNMRVLRLYECRCDLHQSHYESVLKKDNCKNGYKEKIGQENLTIMRMISLMQHMMAMIITMTMIMERPCISTVHNINMLTLIQDGSK